jgi:geranylgeranyl pyrophosphate synthase
MQLKEIYSPIENELNEVAKTLEQFLSESENKSILEVSQFLLLNPGKRLRPALVLLSAKATLVPPSNGRKESNNGLSHNDKLAKIASAMEMIHFASLVHDDIIDHAVFRHNKPSINQKWGQEISIALGDYLYSKAFEIISSCRNIDMLYCISQATSMMCEGELAQVCARDSISLMKKQYLSIIEKKTASLFAASCKVGAIMSNRKEFVQKTLGEFGLNFGIAFQIVDDCIDLIGEASDLGKPPGADFKMGELTLPILNLLSQADDKDELISLINQRDNQTAFSEVKRRFVNSQQALVKTREDIHDYIQKAKKSLLNIEESIFKQSMISLADLVAERATF